MPPVADGLERLSVDLADRGYDIVIGPSLIDRVGALLDPVLESRRVVIVSDETVAGLYLPRLERALTDSGIRHSAVVVAPGEASKSLESFSALIERMLDGAIERSTTVIALGGGVVGDLAGFAAAVALRGVPFVQIPTTLLAQVDSAVGGKTGLNSRHGKNLIGAFYQPQLVLADCDVLSTLPRRQLLAGYAEVAKYGAIDRPDFFAWLETAAPALLAGDTAALTAAIRQCCAAKAAIVAADEREGGVRALLNLGHTFGHALEAETGYGDVLLHGEAVAIGMVLAFELSVRLGYCPAADAERLRRHLSHVGLPTRLRAVADDDWSADALLAHMAKDKKVRDGEITFILARGIGRAFIARGVAATDVHSVLEEALSA